MARIVKEKAYTEKRNEILDMARKLIYSKGYEQMTIQDIQNNLRISKGAFYHYFDSKQALLEALVERIMEEIEHLLLPVVDDPRLNALEKLQCFFDVIVRWKTAQKTFLLGLLRAWYSDDNALLHQKLRVMWIKQIAPRLAVIIQQGMQEGSLAVSYPEQSGEVVLSIMLDLGETLGALLLSFDPERDDMLGAERTLAAYSQALERTLGAPAGSLCLLDVRILKEWFASPRDNM